MKRNSVPSYLLHKQSGKARAVWTDATGVRHQKLLPGEYDSAESRAAHARLVLDHAKPITTAPTQECISVAELLLAFLIHADKNYTDSEGKPTQEVATIKYSVKPVRELFAELPVDLFGPLALETVREKMIEVGLCRTLINRRVDRIKRCFKWAYPGSLSSSPRTRRCEPCPGSVKAAARRGRSRP